MRQIVTIGLLSIMLAGCETRSISNSGYRDPYGWARPGTELYKGELTELDILGVAPSQEATQQNIEKALSDSTPPEPRRGDKLVVIQSGAGVPDNAMLEAAALVFSVAPFSGVPPGEKAGFSESLRLRAAQGGYRYIFCYWGVLESANVDKEGKVLSWVPIAGFFVPDQRQHMRIRLKGLLVDVASGNWKMLTPEPADASLFTSGWSRESNDQALVEALKKEGYKRLVAELTVK